MTQGPFHNRPHSAVRAADLGSDMTSEEPLRHDVTVKLENGLHMVPCSRITEYVRDFSGTVSVRLNDQTVDAKSIFDLLTLRAPFGTNLTLEVSGQGAADIINGLVALFERNFDTD